MDQSEIDHPAGRGRGRGDRISKLGDSILGHILSFLPAMEAARAAVLSTRWRDVFGSVHTVSLEEPEGPIPNFGRDVCYSPGWGPPVDPDPPLAFTAAVDAAIVARHRAPAAAPPLRALRVALENYRGAYSRPVDQWIYYALKQASLELEIDLRLRSPPLYCRSRRVRGLPPWNSELSGGTAVGPEVTDGGSTAISSEVLTGGCAAICPEEVIPNGLRISTHGQYDPSLVVVNDDNDDEIMSTDDEETRVTRPRSYDPWNPPPPPEYTVPRGLFSCTALRTLRIGPCKLSPPAEASLPWLEELLLTDVSDENEAVHRLISACPRLADLTLDNCDTVTGLDVLGVRLRRFSLRCCHNLAYVDVDASELQALEYRGKVPRSSFLTMRRASPRSSLTSCKVEICGEEELFQLREFLYQMVDTKHLYLQSARLASGISVDYILFPVFRSLTHLDLRGYLRDNDDAVLGAMSRVLHHAPNLEVLSLVFEIMFDVPCDHYGSKDGKLLDAHLLKYDRCSIFDAPSAMISTCLTNRVREINLVHYQGSRAQRRLVRFLLLNAPVIGELWCQFAEGPLWIQTQLMREMKGWMMNEKANAVFR